jgi:hypothetical protein|tara:strand:+ start:8299 stop:8706 length:408 start_codon:yes stop_codon:yes gene_type:complete
MSFKPLGGSWTSKYYATKTAVLYSPGMVVYSDGTNIIPAVAATEDILGIVDEEKLAADTSTKRIKILVPRDSSALMEGDVGTGTPTAANEGILCDLDDTYPSTKVDVSSTTESCLRLEKFISSTVCLFSIVPTKR